MNLPILNIVVPCYNEEDVLSETIKRLSYTIKDLINDQLVSESSKVVFVDDGSSDNTWEIIQKNNMNNPLISGLKLSRNVGHQNALLAGLMYAKENSDCIISIDADLQDDLEVIKSFVKKFHEGYEVVYGVRNKRVTDTLFKRTTAIAFYKLMLKMGVNIVYNHADFRLLSKRVVNHLEDFEEANIFLRGLIPLIGFKSTEVYYDRAERFAGESKYPLKKMLSFAFDGITSFSVKPIRLISSLGFFLSIFSIIAAVYVIYSNIWGKTISGWSSLMISIWFIGGVQLLSVGLIGEYIGKVYKEVKRRPKYIIEEEVKSDSKVYQLKV